MNKLPITIDEVEVIQRFINLNKDCDALDLTLSVSEGYAIELLDGNGIIVRDFETLDEAELFIRGMQYMLSEVKRKEIENWGKFKGDSKVKIGAENEPKSYVLKRDFLGADALDNVAIFQNDEAAKKAQDVVLAEEYRSSVAEGKMYKGEAPWSPEQFDYLLRYQQDSRVHPYTCGEDCDGKLVPLKGENGFICDQEGCNFTQNWAMFPGSVCPF